METEEEAQQAALPGIIVEKTNTEKLEKTLSPIDIKSEELLTTEKPKADEKSTVISAEPVIPSVKPEKKIIKKKVPKKKPRVELFEEIDVKYFSMWIC